MEPERMDAAAGVGYERRLRALETGRDWAVSAAVVMSEESASRG